MKAIEFIKRISKEKTLIKGLNHFPKGHLLTAGVLSATLLVGFISTSTSATDHQHRDRQVVKLNIEPTEILLPAEAPRATTHTKEPASHSTDNIITETVTETDTTPLPETSWQIETVKNGDNLSLLFNRVGLSDVKLYDFLHSGKAAKQLTRIYPGQKIEFKVGPNGELEGLRYKENRLHTIEFTRSDKGFKHNTTVLEPDIHVAYREATIVNSLFLAGTDAGMEQSLIMELAGIFGWDIDFALDIRTNDSFKVLYEEKFINGEKIGNGAILAAEFTNQNITYRAVRYTGKDGHANYFTPDGRSMRKAFLRTPVDFTRISSHFDPKRRHPILNKVRAHKGTDYAAPTGTPIKAAGNGKVIFAGTKGGYGRTVIIKHGQSYKTLYAHMHKYGKGIRNGTKVRQGQIIGYVGSSGMSTGPHLHYEFHKNGVVRNPVTVKLPQAKSIPKSLLNDFMSQTRPLVAKLDRHHGNTQLALSKKSTTTN